MGGDERLGGYRAAGVCVCEHRVEVAVGELERVRRHQSENEQVERPGDVGVLLRQQPVIRERPLDESGRGGARLAGPRSLERETRQHESLSGGVAGEVGVALQPRRDGAAGLQAALLSVRGPLRFQQQRKLAIAVLELVDRVADAQRPDRRARTTSVRRRAAGPP